jgi:hypothetical protein
MTRTTEYGGQQEHAAWEAQEWDDLQGAHRGIAILGWEGAEELLELVFVEGDCGTVTARKVSVIDALKKLPEAQRKLLLLVTMGYTESKASEMAGLNPTNQSRNYRHALRAFINAYNGWPITLSLDEGVKRRAAERERMRQAQIARWPAPGTPLKPLREGKKGNETNKTEAA